MVKMADRLSSSDPYRKAQQFAEQVDHLIQVNQKAHAKALETYRTIQSGRFVVLQKSAHTNK